MNVPPTHIVVLDFDGTITKLDISDEICKQFAGPTWRDIDLQWERRELSLAEAQTRIWRMVRGTRQELVAHAKKVGGYRAGLDLLLDSVRANQAVQLWLASGGFDFYIQPIMGERLRRFSRAYFHKGEFVAKRVQLTFQHADLACPSCAICKGKVIDLALQQPNVSVVVFAGDGSSDRCVIERDDPRLQLYAVGGSFLEKLCVERGRAYRAMRSIDEVLEQLPIVR